MAEGVATGREIGNVRRCDAIMQMRILSSSFKMCWKGFSHRGDEL